MRRELHVAGPRQGLITPLGKPPCWVAVASPTRWGVTYVDPYLLFICGGFLSVISGFQSLHYFYVGVVRVVT